ncbi:hypothetical protein BGX34_006777 [Mortierella sp. NVP85]|nr:hypothetical protein BGX34_006777 [Mortierella sp. NVP85]
MGDENELEEEDRQEYRNVGAAIERIPQMRLGELVLSSIPGIVMENILHPLLERCPSIEKLHLGKIYALRTLEHLAKTLKENKLPTLRHLTLGRLYSDGKALEKVVSHIACGLDSFVLEDEQAHMMAPFLIQHHSRSLTRLEMGLSPWLLSDLMAGLPCLQTVRFIIYVDDDDEVTDVRPPDKDWKCVDLRNLQLYLALYIHYGIGDDEWKGSFAKMCMDHVFSQVGKLRRLQELNLGCKRDMYLKKHGYLEQLAGLKQLKVLDLTKTNYTWLEKQEASWMAENWPKLLQICPDHLPAIFKKTLLRERPLVEFIKGR